MISPHAFRCAFLTFTTFLGSAVAQTATTKYVSSVTTGLVGMAVTQTAQLNVLNLAAPTLSTTPVALCTVELDIYDAQSRLLNTSKVSLPPGASASLALTYSKLPPVAVGFHALVRGVVRTIAAVTPFASSGAISTSCNLFTTLELFDSTTGVTQTVTSDTRPD